MSTASPKPSAITASAFSYLLKVYPEVQKAAYKAKVKDPKKLVVAQKDHDWRYNELPGLLKGRASKSSTPYLDKDEMVRLTQWKIVHGQHRPFLPGMVKKNDPEMVKEVTTSAFAIQAGASYSGTDLPESLNKALREAAQLNGVGPATATLVCSIYDPDNISFFEDELAEWMCPEIPKLKYTWAEYKMLFTEIRRLRTRLGFEHPAVDVEKVGFVVGHLHLLEEHQRTRLSEILDEKAPSDAKAEPKSPVKSKSSSSKDISTAEEVKPLATAESKASSAKRKSRVLMEGKDEVKPKAKRTKGK